MESFWMRFKISETFTIQELMYVLKNAGYACRFPEESRSKVLDVISFEAVFSYTGNNFISTCLMARVPYFL